MLGSANNEQSILVLLNDSSPAVIVSNAAPEAINILDLVTHRSSAMTQFGYVQASIRIASHIRLRNSHRNLSSARLNTL